MAFGIDDAVLLATTVAPYVAKLFGGDSGPQLTDFEKLTQNKLQNIIKAGGVGMAPGELDTRYGQGAQQIKANYSQARTAADYDAARRGTFRSGVSRKQYRDIGLEENKSLVQLMRDLQLADAEMKRNSYLGALGMGTNVSGAYGDLNRSAAANDQSSILNLLSSVASIYGKKMANQNMENVWQKWFGPSTGSGTGVDYNKTLVGDTQLLG